MKINPMLLLDSYKLSHPPQYPAGTTLVYSNWTPRSSRIEGIDEVVFFGLQYFIKEYLIDQFNQNFFHRPKADVISEYVRQVSVHIGPNPNVEHVKALHDLGYLPIEIKAIPEGAIAPLRTAMLTIVNTHSDFYWVTNMVESLMSNVLWMPCTSATIALQYRKRFEAYAEETGADKSFIPFQGHDFSFRGLSGVESACTSGSGHLLSFVGSDTVPCISFLEAYYNADYEKELISVSVPATEHSVMCMGSSFDENGGDDKAILERMLDLYPTGIVSIVADSYDYWRFISEYVRGFKDKIMSRDGKCVLRPDSGDPVEIICGVETVKLTGSNKNDAIDKAVYSLYCKVAEETPHGEPGDDYPEGIFEWNGKTYKCVADLSWNRYDKQYYYIDDWNSKSFEEVELTPEQKGSIEVLWDIFGGTINEKGFKELDPHIGLIYGDSITPARQEEILRRLAEKGFASSNIVLGIGSFTYQYNTRDTFGFAMKATYGEINGEPKEIFKDPKTDDGIKKSARGLLHIQNGVQTDQVNWQKEKTGGLTTVFKDGTLTVDQSLSEIRERLIK
jgi:nicotinamide phosphoribosyltransferase